MYDLKKGDVMLSKREAWEIKEKQSGICLCELVWLNPKVNSALKVGLKAPFSHSHLKHKLVGDEFILIPKAKKSTIQVLFT